ncbi:MAG TPA: GTPase Era [Thermodesulfobacteriota bacterium]|nr:GTPase Era [Thermodesulfobacteriota bacterium]
MATPFKVGFIGIIGPPNVGKSTLINTLIGEKISIVTPKPQTTRNRILGIKNLPDAQLIFVDTPGIHPTRKKFNRHLVQTAQAAFRESDLVLVMVEATQATPGNEFLFVVRCLKGFKKPVFLLINKIDLIEKQALLPFIDVYQAIFPFQEIIPLSALHGSGVDHLEKLLLHYLPEGPKYYPDDLYTDQTERFMVAEIIREKIFVLLQQEIPYSIAVAIEEFNERQPGMIFIRAAIWVEKLSQKGILIGKEGKMLREIGKRARKEIENLLQTKVYLELWVTVKKNWTCQEARIKQSLGS